MLPPRITNKIVVNPETGCWEWTASKSPGGYGIVWFLDGERKRSGVAHRHIYTLLVGPVPDGLDLDHLCRVRHCVNPAHLEPVTRRENIMRGVGVISAIYARQTHCVNGHEFTPENTVVGQKNSRRCLACQRRRSRESGKRRTRRLQRALLPDA